MFFENKKKTISSRSSSSQTHNCVQALRIELNLVKNELQKCRTDMDLYKSEVRTLQVQIRFVFLSKIVVLLSKEFIRVLRVENPTISQLYERVENDEILRWSNNLQLARVTRWGGMISTPDAVLQAVIKRALLESGCPINITNELMENAHERHWPQGLSTLGKL